MKMVTRGAYYPEEDTTFRRCGRDGQSFPLTQDRQENTVHGGVRVPYNDARNGDHSQEHDSTGHTRRRIPVACNRCRKRKIRCSGDPLDGGQCFNCKSAGNTECHFLRVSALPLEQSNNLTELFHNSNARFINRLPSNTQLAQAYYQSQNATPTNLDGLNYRSNTLSYNLAGPKYLGMGYSDYSEDSVEFGVPTPPFQVVGPEPEQNFGQPTIGISYQAVPVSNYPTQNLTRQRTNPPLNYMDPVYGSDSKNYSLNGNERVLPQPVVNRQYPRSNDGLANSQHALQPSYGIVGSNMMNGNSPKGLSSSMHESNLYISSSNIASEAAEMAYNSQQHIATSQAGHDLYTTQQSHPAMNYYPQPNESSPELSNYGTSSGSDTTRSRQSSQTNTTESSLSANNRKYSGSTLASGHGYQPIPAQESYPLPPLPAAQDLTQNHNALQQQQIGNQQQQHLRYQHHGLPHSHSQQTLPLR